MLKSALYVEMIWSFKFFDDKHKYPDWKMSFIYFLRLFSKDVFSPYTILPTVLCAQK